MSDRTFIFQACAFDAPQGVLTFNYAFENGPSFEERIVVGVPSRTLSAGDTAALESAIRLLFLLAGVSYYKAFVPPRLECRAFALDAELAAFVTKVYEKGLAEFAFRNELDLNGKINFQTADAPRASAQRLSLPRRALVPVGGGKDSVVSIEGLRAMGEEMSLFVLASPGDLPKPIADSIRVAGLPHIHAARTISPALIELNKLPGTYNGHIPITAIVSATALVCAILHGFDTVVLSNERSASAPNLSLGAHEINHQYSKSFEFETDLVTYVHDRISPDLAYFSLLRPLSECEIARRFAKLDAYHPVFRSCNTAFRQDPAKRGANWCCDCPKCRFVFLALAPFVPKAELTGIFGQDMLDQPDQIEGFAELAGLSQHKPFECVGEIEESALLLRQVLRMPQWAGDTVVANLGTRLEQSGPDFVTSYAKLFEFAPEHAVPPRYLEGLHACR